MAEPLDAFIKASKGEFVSAVSQLGQANIDASLGETARRARRALLAFGSAAFVLAYYPIDPSRVPWLEVPAPDDSGDLLGTLIFVGLAYHLVTFVLLGLQDLRRWHIGLTVVPVEATHQSIYRLGTLADTLTTAAGQQQSSEGKDKVLLAAQNIVDFLAVAKPQLLALHKRYLSLTRLVRLSAWGWEFALPVGFGLLAGYRLAAQLSQ